MLHIYVCNVYNVACVALFPNKSCCRPCCDISITEDHPVCASVNQAEEGCVSAC